MNFDNMNILSQKVEGVLATVRNLRVQISSLQQALQKSEAEAHDKTMLLEAANRNLVDCKAALNARANQVAAQDSALNEARAALETATEKLTSNSETINALNTQAAENASTIATLSKQIEERDGIINSINSQLSDQEKMINTLTEQVNEKAGSFETLSAQIAEKDGLIDALNAQIAEKAAAIEEKDRIINAQGEEIAEAQERFQQLLATIEKELGTEIPIEQHTMPAEQDFSQEPTAESPAAEPVVEPLEEPAPVDNIENIDQETLEEEPVIEVHAADEKDNDLFASNGGSQGGFFG